MMPAVPTLILVPLFSLSNSKENTYQRRRCVRTTQHNWQSWQRLFQRQRMPQVIIYITYTKTVTCLQRWKECNQIILEPRKYDVSNTIIPLQRWILEVNWKSYLISLLNYYSLSVIIELCTFYFPCIYFNICILVFLFCFVFLLFYYC